eukprot:XP_001704475.1 Hypothetical protein GL50803_3260 [Giardia lamblia ATCC 50803]
MHTETSVMSVSAQKDRMPLTLGPAVSLLLPRLLNYGTLQTQFTELGRHTPQNVASLVYFS